MPEAGDAFASVGYLIAAAGITVVALAGYGALLAQRLAKEQLRNQQLQSVPHGGEENT